ncbi:uncharacterized protein LOC127102898 [Lathyrus oleraceus]|uniref:uncharacterized protein LOC127102898 n=1 Tax=Pisum sativum TaxID=3888 RepID=UPI0021D0B270|nr:uncharacterized protein LOC127102898 [Pisum sativum]
MENVEKWKYVYQIRLSLERELGKDVFECKKVLSLIQEAGLMKIVTGYGKCYVMLIKEFIMNISKECDNKRSKEFRKAYVRVRCVDFSPEIVNRIGAANWVPTNHTSNIATGLGKFIYIVGTKSNFDFAAYVFYQTMKHVASYPVKLPIAFPYLICGVILSQHPSILINFDSTCKMDPSLSLHYRLFTRKHVPDIVMTSGHTSSRSTDRTIILTELEDTCKTLDENIKNYTESKCKLEMLIKALSEEEGGEKADRTDDEKDNKDRTTTSDEEETNSDED